MSPLAVEVPLEHTPRPWQGHVVVLNMLPRELSCRQVPKLSQVRGAAAVGTDEGPQNSAAVAVLKELLLFSFQTRFLRSTLSNLLQNTEGGYD